MTRSVATDVDLLDAEDVGIEFCQGCQDFFGLVVAFNIPLETANRSLAFAVAVGVDAVASVCCCSTWCSS